MSSVDTNCLLRWVIGDVPEQADAVQRLIDDKHRLAVSDVCLVEAVFAMEHLYQLGRPQVVLAINAIANESAFQLESSFWSAMLDDYLSHPKLSIVDVYVVHKARHDQTAPVYTLDRKLANQMSDTCDLKIT